MTNLPTNPTKTEIMEKYWYEFLDYVNFPAPDSNDTLNYRSDMGNPMQILEFGFWQWYKANKMGGNDAGTPPS